MSFAYQLVDNLKALVYNPNLNGDKKALKDGLKQCVQASKLIATALKNASSVGEKNHLLACLGQIKSFKQMFKAVEVTGFGYVPRNETSTHRVKWVDLHSAFQSRMRTSVIINLKHKDVESFLEDCAALFKKKSETLSKRRMSSRLMLFCVGNLKF